MRNVIYSPNTELTILYWQVGNRILYDILKEKRAEYGKEIVATLSQELSWSHFVAILPLKDGLQRNFYAEMCRIERWSVRTLRKKIDGMLLLPAKRGSWLIMRIIILICSFSP